MQTPNKRFTFYFFIIFLFTMLVALIFLSVVIFYRYNARKENIISLYREQLTSRYDEIEILLSNIVSDLFILSEIDPFRDFLNDGSEQSLTNAEQLFKLISTERGLYDQIRFLDEKGFEIIRVNYNNGEPFVVTVEELQFKGNRYYFQDTFELEKGKVFFSPLDLNIERGVVERPEKPMIRVGIPVFDDEGLKRGIILLNYFGYNIIDIVSKTYVKASGSFFLLNADSYWLYSQDHKKSWAFMYGDRQLINFKNAHPETWVGFINAISGTLRNSDGVYIFDTVSPLYDYMKTSTGSPYANGKSDTLNTEDYFWKIAVYLPNTVFSNLSKMIAIDMIPLILAIIMASIIGALVLSKLWFVLKSSEEQTRKSLEEKELLLREIHHRVNNSLALVSSFIGLYSSSHADDTNSSFFQALRQKIDTISIVHSHLYQSTDIEHIGLESYLKAILDNMLADLSAGPGTIKLEIMIDDISINASTAITLGLIVSELAMNSLKHAFPKKQNGKISVYIRREELDCEIIYSDDGIGLPEDFTTRDSDSLGMVLIESLTKQLGGSLSISTGSNSTFKINFPVID